MTEKVPREQLVVEEILREENVSKYEPGVVAYIMDYVYCYLQTVLEDAKIYSEHANKRHVDLDDLKLAVNLTLDKTHNTLPSKEFLLKLAKEKNSQPLPLIPEGRCGIRLPPDRLCLTNSNISIKRNQKPSVESALSGAFRGFPGSYGVKVEPQMPPPQQIQPTLPLPISNPYSTFTEQFQEPENVGFQQKHYGGQVYGKRKHDQMDLDDYDI